MFLATWSITDVSARCGRTSKCVKLKWKSNYMKCTWQSPRCSFFYKSRFESSDQHVVTCTRFLHKCVWRLLPFNVFSLRSKDLGSTRNKHPPRRDKRETKTHVMNIKRARNSNKLFFVSCCFSLPSMWHELLMWNYQQSIAEAEAWQKNFKDTYEISSNKSTANEILFC